eukprot:gene9662-10649_t
MFRDFLNFFRSESKDQKPAVPQLGRHHRCRPCGVDPDPEVDTTPTKYSDKTSDLEPSSIVPFLYFMASNKPIVDIIFTMFPVELMEDGTSADVAEISDDQPRNYYDEIQILAGHSDYIHYIVRIDETRLLTASHDNTAAIWSIANGSLLFKLEGHTKPINCALSLSYIVTNDDYDGDEINKVLLTGSLDKTLQFWSLEDGQNKKVISDHNHAIMCFIPLRDNDDEDAAYCAAGDDISLWNQKMELLHVFQRESDGYIKALLSIKDKKIVASSDKKKLVVYAIVTSDAGVELQLSRKLAPHREAVTCLVNISDAMFASASLDGTIVVWTTYHLFPTRQFNFHEIYLDSRKNIFMYSVKHLFALEQRYIFAAISNGFYVFDTISDRCLVKQPNAHHENINQMALVSDDKLLATCSVDGTIRLWGAPSPVSSGDAQERRRAKTPLERLIGKRMKIAQQSSVTLELIGECAGNSNSVQFIVPCGQEGFVSCSSDNMLIMWKDGRLQSRRREQYVREIIQQTGQFNF